MKYGYARCSTNESKQDIDRQIDMLFLQGVKQENIYFEYESGAKVDRVQLNRLLDALEDGDVIITTEVSRITRSTKQLCELVEIAIKKKLCLVFETEIKK